MSMSTHVYAIKPPDDKWKKMRDAYNACKSAGIEPPTVLCKFFEYTEPDSQGVIVEIKPRENDAKEMVDSFEIDIESLPKDTKTIRFSNCY